MDSLPNPIILIGGLAMLAMAPFMAIMVSSYLKIVVVIYILRNALGLQQVPPNLAVNGLAIILTLYIMAPVGMEVKEEFSAYNVRIDNLQDPKYFDALQASIEPMRGYLIKHSDVEEREFFASTTTKLWPKEQAQLVTSEHFLVLLPSFMMSQLKSAFQIGFLLYLPFIIIDLVVSNILLSMGMIMMSPFMVSLPFKILLFVMVDGWSRLIHGLVLSYR